MEKNESKDKKYDYEALAGAALKAEKKIQEASERFAESLNDIFEEVSLEDMDKFVHAAKDDENISTQLFKCCIEAFKCTHPHKKVEVKEMSGDELLTLFAAMKILLS